MEFEPIDLAAAPRADVLLFVDGVLQGETNWTANLANVSAILHEALGRVNWTGFYLMARDGQELTVGPFQGKVACTRIAVGQGVVGHTAQSRQTTVVPNVLEFPGHIACDSASRSEVVAPILAADGRLVGVIDVDSPEFDRFGPDDVALVEEVARRLGQHWPPQYVAL
jgi:L-methionine (R)-S-oxide reductase